MTIECPREADVVDAVASGRWPDRAGDLRAHAESCAVCADVALVSSAIALDAHDDWAEPPSLPSAEIAWLRAQARARAEAHARVARPIVVMQAMSLAALAGILSAVAGTMWWWMRDHVSWLVALMTPDSGAAELIALLARGGILAIATWLVLAPVAVYLVTIED